MTIGLLYPIVGQCLAVDLHRRTILLVNESEPQKEGMVLFYCEGAVHGVFSISVIGIIPLKLSKLDIVVIFSFAFSILCAAFDIFFSNPHLKEFTLIQIHITILFTI